MLQIAATSVAPIVYPHGLFLQAVIRLQHVRLHVLENPLNRTSLELLILKSIRFTSLIICLFLAIVKHSVCGKGKSET